MSNSVIIDYKTPLIKLCTLYGLNYELNTFKCKFRSAENQWECTLTITNEKLDESRTYKGEAKKENHSEHAACQKALNAIHEFGNPIYKLYLKCKEKKLPLSIGIYDSRDCQMKAPQHLVIYVGMKFQMVEYSGFVFTGENDLKVIQEAALKTLKKFCDENTIEEQSNANDNAIETLDSMARKLEKFLQYKCLVSVNSTQNPFYLSMYKIENLVTYDYGETELEAKKKAAHQFLCLREFGFKLKHKQIEFKEKCDKLKNHIEKLMKKRDELESNCEDIQKFLEEFPESNRKRTHDQADESMDDEFMN